MPLPYLEYLEHVRRESDRFLAVLRDLDPAVRVPSCPDWDAADLLWHLTEVQWFWGTIIAERRTSPDGLEAPPRPPDHAALVDALVAQSTALQRALESTDPTTEVYMWAEDKTVGYIGRRQAHEALIHRLDAELAADQVTSLDPALAWDGVREIFEHMYGGSPPWGTFTPDGSSVAFTEAETGARLRVLLGRFTGTDPDDGTRYDEPDVALAEHDGPAEATVAGTAADLDAWLWHRRDDSAITITGDPTITARLQAILDQPLT